MRYRYQVSPPVPQAVSCVHVDGRHDAHEPTYGELFRAHMRKMARTFPKFGPKMVYTLPYWLYRGLISPMRPACCRFYPTCSEYALLALLKYGPARGLAMAAWRILRCNPFTAGGYDPVP